MIINKSDRLSQSLFDEFDQIFSLRLRFKALYSTNINTIQIGIISTDSFETLLPHDVQYDRNEKPRLSSY